MWPVLRYHAEQTSLWTGGQRFSVVAAGRGSGKTELARRRVVYYLGVQKPWSDPQYFYALPTYGQAKRVAWQPIKKLVPKEWVADISESDMCITTVFGSKLWVVGLDKPQRIEGTQWDGGVEDECSDQPPKVFDLTIRPALSHRKGWCWMVGVPKRFGTGAPDFKAKFDAGLAGADPDMRSYTWRSDSILSAEEIESVKRQLDEADYDEQYGASWVSIRGVVYHAFNDANINPQVAYNPRLPIVVGQDFNVDPMSWCLSHVIDGKVLVFDELSIKNTNTVETLNQLHDLYGDHQAGWVFIGDASARARKTSASTTDYIQIKADSRFENKRMRYTTSNPAIHDRNAAVNAMLKNKAGERRIQIHPKCKVLIKDLRHLSYKAGTREINLANKDLGHMSDAFGYTIHGLFPVQFDHQPLESSLVSSD